MAITYTPKADFDQLFLSHLGSMLRPKYDHLVSDYLPERYWDLLIQFADAEANSVQLGEVVTPSSPHQR